MAKRSDFKMSVSERRRRRFSDNFKQSKVREIESGVSKISDICKQYEVSDINVYRWLNKFGSMKTKKERLIVESESDTKQLLELRKQVAELERIIGQKQIIIDFQEKMMSIAEETYGIDIKKKSSGKPSTPSGTPESNTPLA